MTAPRPIFLHGAIAGPSSWGSVPERFDGGAVVGLPGHPAGPPVDDADRLVAWTAAAIGQLEGPRVLVGSGLGAQLALRIAHEDPELVNGIVAIGIAERLQVPDVGRDLDDAIDTLLATSVGDPDGDFADSLELAMQIVGPVTLAADLAITAAIDLGPLATGIACPVLVITGSNDRWAPVAGGAALTAALPHAQMVMVDGAAHLVHADAPRTTELLVAAFLARLELTAHDG
jgi:pimeloyl-ACP methyl ester carboxylesterase